MSAPKAARKPSRVGAMAPYPSDLSIMEVISTRTGLTITQIEDVFSHLTVWDVTWAVLDKATRLDKVKSK